MIFFALTDAMDAMNAPTPGPSGGAVCLFTRRNCMRSITCVLIASSCVLVTAAPAASAAMLRGTSGSDTLTGTGQRDVLRGYAGADAISANAGNDTVWGDAGTDTIDGGAGHDVILAGAGTDTVDGGSGK